MKREKTILTREKARAMLILFYRIDNPTEKQIAEFILFGRVSRNEKRENFNEEQKEKIQREIKENECFFRSEWAKDLAGFIGFAYNPETLIKKLRRETE